MKDQRIIPTLVLLSFLTWAAPAGAADVIHQDLEARFAAAAPGELVDAYLVMADQLTLGELEELCGGMSPRERRPVVRDRLKEHAAGTQTAVREVLDRAIDGGQAELTEILWMGNAIIFSADRDTILRLAAVPGVDRIRPVVAAGPEAWEDVAPSATYPFYDDFESGVLGSHWTVQTTGNGYAQVRSDNGPLGQYHLLMASSVSNSASTASVTVVLDLTGQTDVGVKMQFKEFSDESNTLDGVFISDDGLNFHKVLSLAGDSAYAIRAVELDPYVQSLGLTYNNNFHVRFSWEDNYDIPTDGFAFDEIQIAKGVGKPPPPVPEPNIVQLQAPQLWAMGHKGQGILIANVDSGADWNHPDLVNRTWQNPNEILNGIDDDKNGKIDDIVGWDFASNDNDPSTSATHGTQTAGLMVGDGSMGKITGMAIEGTMAVCLISGEANYWQAQQYGLAIGIDVLSSSHSFKWPYPPDYHMHRQMCEMELAAGIIHANSIGNQGNSTSSYPVPWNVSTPGNCPQPWGHPSAEPGGRSSVMGCAGIHVSDDSLYTSSGQGPSAWEDVKIYSSSYPFSQNPAFWDYPVGGFAKTLPGLLKPDVVTYTDSVISTYNGGGYSSFSGTSAATPQLGGGMMLLREVQPEAQPRHICAAIELSAVDLGPAGKDTRFGAGKLQVYDAARHLVVLGQVDDQTPSIGQVVNLSIFGEPGATVYGFAGAQITAGAGLFNLVPPFLVLNAYPLDASGQKSAAIPLPNNPNLIGVTVYLQFGAYPVAGSPWGVTPLFSVPELVVIGP